MDWDKRLDMLADKCCILYHELKDYCDKRIEAFSKTYVIPKHLVCGCLKAIDKANKEYKLKEEQKEINKLKS